MTTTRNENVNEESKRRLGGVKLEAEVTILIKSISWYRFVLSKSAHGGNPSTFASFPTKNEYYQCTIQNDSKNEYKFVKLII